MAAIIRRRVPGASVSLTEQVARGVARLRDLDLAKPPGRGRGDQLGRGPAHARRRQPGRDAAAERTAGAVLKYAEDYRTVREAGFAVVVTAGALAGGRSGIAGDVREVTWPGRRGRAGSG